MSFLQKLQYFTEAADIRAQAEEEFSSQLDTQSNKMAVRVQERNVKWSA